jgi:formylglycine-generating enzyme
MSPELYWPFQEKTVTTNANVALDRSMTLAAPQLARIPGGEFLMGAADGQPDERPVHRVRVSEFFIGRFHVTNDEYARFVRATGHPAPDVRGLPLFATGEREARFREFAAPYLWQNAEPPTGRGNHPVVLVTYDDAVAYCGWLSVTLQRPVRLPTEAEWEKAARGGAEAMKYPWGNEIDPSCCNYLSDPSTMEQRGTRPTGTYPPNPFGLCDVIGNAWVWIADWYSSDYYGGSEAADPHGPSSGGLRVVRGGSWITDNVSMLRTAYRHAVPPDSYAYSIGFRIVCSE